MIACSGSNCNYTREKCEALSLPCLVYNKNPGTMPKSHAEIALSFSIISGKLTELPYFIASHQHVTRAGCETIT
jgi:hypothetical protein